MVGVSSAVNLLRGQYWPLIKSRQTIMLTTTGLGLIVAVLVRAWRKRMEEPAIFRLARWLGAVLLLEALFQVIILVFGLLVPLLIVYTVVAALLWALLVALMVRTGLHATLT